MLLEGGFDVNEENIVCFCFPTIDREELRAHQNHGLQLAMANSISVSEFRKEYLNKKPLTEEQRKDTFMAYEMGNEMMMLEETARLTPTPSGQTNPVANSVSNRSQPTNQFGTLPTAPQFAENDMHQQTNDFVDGLRDHLLESCESADDADLAFNSRLYEFVPIITETNTPLIESSITRGWNNAKVDLPEENSEDVHLGSKAKDKFYRNFIKKSYFAIAKPIFDSVKASYLQDDLDKVHSEVSDKLEDLRSALHKLHKEQEITAERFGYASLAKRAGHKSVAIFNESRAEPKVIALDQIYYRRLLPEPGDLEIKLHEN